MEFDPGGGERKWRPAGAPGDADLIEVIFWFKDEHPEPVYTLDARAAAAAPTDDAREGDLDEPHVTNRTVIGERVRLALAAAVHYPAKSPGDSAAFKLDLASEFPVIKLLVARAQLGAQGKYRCRIDYRRRPTWTQSVELQLEGELGETVARPLVCAPD